jgi:molecular chaperone DnaK (HSP70)
MLCIDFGSDNCFVGIFKNDKVEVIPTEDGIRNFACDVSFTEDDG